MKRVLCTCDQCGATADAVAGMQVPEEWTNIGPIDGKVMEGMLVCQKCLRAIVQAFPGLRKAFNWHLWHDVEFKVCTTSTEPAYQPSPNELMTNILMPLAGVSAETWLVRARKRIRTATSIREIVIDAPNWEIVDVLIGHRSQRSVIESDRGHAIAPLRFPLDTVQIMMDVEILAKFVGDSFTPQCDIFAAIIRGRAQGDSSPNALVTDPRQAKGAGYISPYEGDLSAINFVPR